MGGKLGGKRSIGSEVERAVVGVWDWEVGKDDVVCHVFVAEWKSGPANLGCLFPVVVDFLKVLVEEFLLPVSDPVPPKRTVMCLTFNSS